MEILNFQFESYLAIRSNRIVRKSVWFSLCEIVLVTISGATSVSKPAITQAELVGRAQELVDAAATGDQPRALSFA